MHNTKTNKIIISFIIVVIIFSGLYYYWTFSRIPIKPLNGYFWSFVVIQLSFVVKRDYLMEQLQSMEVREKNGITVVGMQDSQVAGDEFGEVENYISIIKKKLF